MGEAGCTWSPTLCDCEIDGDDNDIDGADLAVLTAEFDRADCPLVLETRVSARSDDAEESDSDGMVY